MEAIRETVPARAGDTTLDTLLKAVQELSLAREIEQVQRIVRSSARRLTGADGATFVLRDGDECFYADEEAVSPLWKGQRFPLADCISGWAMLNKQHVVIEDIYADERIPHAAYRPTFVKSLVMVPIRTMDPLGAIGIYWARRHHASPQQVGAARALADSAAVALEHVQVLEELARTVELSETDPLTGLPNRRVWDALLDAAVRPDKRPLCVALVDLDEFKAYNDLNGHQAGDALLRQTAAAWRAALRATDVVARYGGDEFAVLMPGCDATRGLKIAERLRLAVPPGGTASIGIAQWNGSETPDELTARADAAL
jgi:diguanylate cyclase (GGDEF)-like protein